MDDVKTFGFILALAVLSEGLIEYFIAPLVSSSDPEKWYNKVPVLRYVSAVVGVLLSILYGADLLAMLYPESSAMFPYVGMVLTGLIIGRGSNYLHDWLGQPVLKALMKK